MSQDKQADETFIKEDKKSNFPPLSVKNCPNCEEILTGAYCLSCGQKDYNMLRPFWTLMEDTLGDLFAFDSRFSKTILPLFFIPGHVTREYNRGRRASFVPPFRQYLVISVIFFLLLVNIDIQLFETPNLKNLKTSQDSEIIALEAKDTGQDLLRGNDTPEILNNLSQDLKRKSQEEDSKSDAQAYDGAINTLEGLKKIFYDPKLLNVIIADWVPKIMFLMLPIFAVLLKIFYIRRKKFYIEHLVFSLHFHAMIFLLLIMILLFYRFMPVSHDYLELLLWYIPVYLFLALWRVYKQGSVKTFFKAVFISITYISFISIGIGIAVLYGISQA